MIMSLTNNDYLDIADNTNNQRNTEQLTIKHKQQDNYRNRRCLSDTDLVAQVPTGAAYDSSDQSEDRIGVSPEGVSEAQTV